MLRCRLVGYLLPMNRSLSFTLRPAPESLLEEIEAATKKKQNGRARNEPGRCEFVLADSLESLL